MNSLKLLESEDRVEVILQTILKTQNIILQTKLQTTRVLNHRIMIYILKTGCIINNNLKN